MRTAVACRVATPHSRMVFVADADATTHSLEHAPIYVPDHRGAEIVPVSVFIHC
jgi:hypothetical protein